MFERFTDRARSVVVLAQEEARMLNHNYIGTEHILLGLVREEEGVGAKALESLGVSLDGARRSVEEIIDVGEGPVRGHIPFTPRAKRVLELALREALALGHNYIGTEHILLGLIREGEGVGAQVLTKLGASFERVRDNVTILLEGGTVEREGIVKRPTGRMPLTARALDAMDLASDFARKRGHRRIDPGDLLLGSLALVSDYADAQPLLEGLGMDREEIRRRIDELSATEEESRGEEPSGAAEPKAE